MARGEYIGIVESDDYVEPTMFEKLYNAAVEYNLDVARCCFNSLCNGQFTANNCKFLPKNIVFDPEIKVDAFRHPPSIWAAIYRRSMLENQGIKFRETPGAAYQDTSFAFKTTLAAKRMLCLNECLLNYRIHANNSVKKATNAFVVIDEIDECIRFAQQKKANHILKKVLLDIEYATFKWNYFRLPRTEAHRFFEAWSSRWKKYSTYASPLPLNHLKRYFHYLAITRFPQHFENYLIKKSNHEL